MAKFGKTWKRRFDALPPLLQEHSIHYKRWKRITRVTPPQCLGSPLPGGPRGRSPLPLPQLARDVEVVERMSRRWAARARRRRPSGGCLAGCLSGLDASADRSESEPSMSEVLEFVELNAAATRKICKRLSKRLHVPASAWLAENGARFSYCSAAHRATLRIAAEGAGECPVCLDELAGSTVVITACGHAFCADCMRRLAGVEAQRGTLHNVLGWARWHRPPFACPTCRARDPTRDAVVVGGSAP